MRLYFIGHDYKYAAEQMLTVLFPGEKPEFFEGEPSGDRAVLRLTHGEKFSTASCELCLGGKAFRGSARILNELVTDSKLQKIVRLSFYRAALRSGVEKPVWGALTGIRPGKLVSTMLESGATDRQARSRFCRDFDVSPERAELCIDTAHTGLMVAKALGNKDVCLYIGIPFCPTRCAYCSFVSASVEKSMKLVEPFLQALFLELDATARQVREHCLRPISIYMGGGTPTTLSARQLDMLCGELREKFDLSAVREFTVEAGRPDTITAEKLEVLRRHGVDRISVNPQTMEDSVLEAIGRKHSAADIENALKLVREVGGFAVNMDLIAGLPQDTAAGFDRTLDRVLALAPENITVHTLALKRGSKILTEKMQIPNAAEVGKMLDSAGILLRARGFAPYYLYRQKYISGGFENVGWCRGGFENIYNVCIMEELCSIISMGGGASTKLVASNGRIVRIFTPKYPLEYIEGIEKTIYDKKIIGDFSVNKSR